MNKKCFVIILLLLLIIAAGAFQFLIKGNTETATDGRVSILLTIDERDLVLTEMRAFLQSAQEIIAAVTQDDLATVVESARRVGATAQGEVPTTLIGKLPLSFKKLGFDTHTRFDQLAMDAEGLGDKEQVLLQLALLMQNCVVCHSGYRIDLEGRQRN